MAQSAAFKPISADSHIAEPPHCWVDYIEPKWREDAPRVIRREQGDDHYQIKGMPSTISLARITSAGWDLEMMKRTKGTFEEVNPGGYDGRARVADQDRDGVAAELIYPSMGMLICALPDLDYKAACFAAYNRWLAEEFCAGAPGRLFGVGCTAARTVDETVADMRRFKEMGFKAIMLSPSPGTKEDYHDPVWDKAWKTSVELDLPISFHCLTSARDNTALGQGTRGPKINGFQAIVRVCQDIIGMFIFGGVFERIPGLKLVSVEADAGWAPHWVYRADHAYKVHRTWLTCGELKKLPSEYFHDNVYLTFQDDMTAFQGTDKLNPLRLLWASDYPHSDSTWPHSQEVIAAQTKGLAEKTKWRILRENVIELYKLPETLGAA